MATFNGTDGNDTLVGGTAADDLHGFGGNDSLLGGDGVDVVQGGAGNDTISGNAGNDWVRGGAGNDRVSGGGGQDSFAFADFGATNADVLVDFAGGWDNIQLDLSGFTALGSTGRFAAGDVRFYAAAGANAGHDADDRIVYNTTTGQLWYDADGSGAGAAQLIATLSNRAAISATDIWAYRSTMPTTGGTAGNDTLTGTAGNDSLDGLAGDDSISGLDGNDSLIGGEGNDTLDGGAGTDTLNGGLGNDTYIEGDTIIDAGGIDTVISLAGGGSLGAGMENLILQGATSSGEAGASGNELDNRITVDLTTADAVWTDGAAGNDTLIGGDNTFDRFSFTLEAGGTEHDIVDGRGAVDWLFFNDAAVVVDFRSGTASNAGPGSGSRVTFTNVEAVQGTFGHDLLIADDGGRRFYGGSGNDTLIGGAGADVLGADNIFGAPADPVGHDSLVGGSGNDALEGGQGADTLDGGLGNDTLSGIGLDADVYRFGVAAGSANADLITDFQSGSDSVLLDSAVMSALGASGSFSENDARFHAAAGANTGHDASDRVIYDTSTGQLWYDADGWGTGAAQLIATLHVSGDGDAAAVTASDIAVNSVTAPRNRVVEGTSGNDALAGGSADDWLFGYEGNDTLNGMGGNDSLFGHWGNDSLVGGGGLDLMDGGVGNDTLEGGAFYTFSVAPGTENADRIASIDTDDTIQIDATVHANAGVTGRLAAGDGRFYAAAGAVGGHDADDRIVFNTSTGQLFYDVDGFGSGTAQLIATLPSGAFPLSATQFEILNGAAPGSGSTINGTAGNDSLVGTFENDTINGFDGADTIDGSGGADSMFGGTGSDVYFVDDANDAITEFVNGGVDWVFSTVDYMLPAWTNNLTLSASAIYGHGNDVENLIVGNASANILNGYESLDTLNGAGGDDRVWGGDGNDSVTGGDGNDVVGGNQGDDTLLGGAGNDQLIGDFGADHFVFTSPAGAANSDTITDFASGEDKIRLDGSVMTALGASGNFTTDDARFFATDGAVNGHDADDRIIYSTLTRGLYYDADGSGSGVAQIIATIQAGGTLTATDIVVDNGTQPPTAGTLYNGTSAANSITGGTGNDTINGNDGNDTLAGGGGNDTINGGAGNDQVEGGAGNDTISGSGGQDSFVFREAGSANADNAVGFASNWDRISLDNAGLGALGADGRFTSSDARFFAGAGANAGQDASDRVVYNTSTGQLWYDADGSGGGASHLIATLQAGAPLVAADIYVI